MQQDLTLQLKKVHQASVVLRSVSDEVIQNVLNDLSELILAESAKLLKVNASDVAKQNPNDPKVDRLLLTQERLENIAAAVRNVALLPDPTNKVLVKRTLANKLKLVKKSVPLGVVCAIYESRPNVTYDIASLCLKSKNACVLKGSSDAENSNHAAVVLIKKALRKNNLATDAVMLLPSERSIVDQLFTQEKYIDVIIPRGSASLINYVRENSKIPVIETGAGVCHTYIHEDADLKKAVKIVINAKVSRPSVCNALDTIIVDKKIANEFLVALAEEIQQYHVELFADKPSYAILKSYPFVHVATPEDFDREFQSLKAAIKVVKDISAALNHIEEHSTKHSEAIVSENKDVCEMFINAVDAAAVYANASTRFTDGEVFGLGAEIGISTQKLHARGPFALEKLVTEKWILHGNGQIR